MLSYTARSGSRPGSLIGVCRVYRLLTQRISQIQEHALQVRAGRAVRWRNLRACGNRRHRPPSRARRAAVVRRMFSRITSAGVRAVDQPRASAGSETECPRERGRRDVDVIVGVVADRVAGGGDFLEPVDVLLFQYATDGEAVERHRRGLDAPARLDGVTLGFVVEIALFVVPVRLLPGREVAAHFQVERDGNLGFAGCLGRGGLFIAARRASPPALPP